VLLTTKRLASQYTKARRERERGTYHLYAGASAAQLPRRSFHQDPSLSTHHKYTYSADRESGTRQETAQNTHRKTPSFYSYTVNERVFFRSLNSKSYHSRISNSLAYQCDPDEKGRRIIWPIGVILTKKYDVPYNCFGLLKPFLLSDKPCVHTSGDEYSLICIHHEVGLGAVPGHTSL